MTNNIDETELARLEEGARAASKGKWVGNIYGEVLVYGGGRHVLVAECKKPHPLDIESGYKVINALYIAAACNAVPALVAEVRRLREALNTFIEEDQSRVILVQQQMLDVMREKVEAWEWWEEVRLYDPWLDHPYAGETKGNAVKSEAFENAIESMKLINIAALKDAGLEEEKENDL